MLISAAALSRTRFTILVGLAVALWLLVELLWLRPESFVADWMGWREADTQTLALNLLADGFDLFHPRVDWGGRGPGFVETEFPLYAALVAAVCAVVGPVEWPGQVLSALCMVGTAIVTVRMLARRFCPGAALVGMLSLLGARATLYLGSSVQPDALAVFLYVSALAAFVRYTEKDESKWLVAAAALTTLAALTKPPFLQLGLTQAVIVVATRRELLQRYAVWLAWAVVLTTTGLVMWHAYSLYLKTGLTFGIIGGERKSPLAGHLLMPGLYKDATLVAIFWGTGVVGALAIAAACVRRTIGAVGVGLLVGNGCLILVALRYTSNVHYGTHYVAPLAILAAWAMAAVVHEAQQRLATGPARRFIAVLLLAQAVQTTLDIRHRARAASVPASALHEFGQAAALADVSAPDDLVVVRSIAPRFDTFWETENNYQDPRVFYLAQRRGWVLGSDETGAAELARLVDEGARWYVDGPGRRDAAFEAWIAAHGSVAWSGQQGRVVKLR